MMFIYKLKSVGKNMRKLWLAIPIVIAMTGCSNTPKQTSSYGNDALPSREVLAFQKMDKELKFKNARIEYDKNSCTVYEGLNAKGEKEQRPLLDKNGKQICN